jgi:hypothetical protein
MARIRTQVMAEWMESCFPLLPGFSLLKSRTLVDDETWG